MPEKFGMVYAFSCGLVQDLVMADALGINALCLASVVCLLQFHYVRIRSYTQFQKAGMVIIMVIVYQSLYGLLNVLFGRPITVIPLLSTAIATGLAWLILFMPVSRLQRRFRLVG